MLTATETQALADVRMSKMRDVAASFLNRTKALHLERDLTDLLIEIDVRHREEVQRLNSIIESINLN